jgi:hypothetical protein
VECKACEETMERVGPALGEVGAESIAADVFHFVFVGEGRYCTCWIFFGEGLVKEDEIREASANGGGGLLERRERCLAVSVERLTDEWWTNICSD